MQPEGGPHGSSRLTLEHLSPAEKSLLSWKLKQRRQSSEIGHVYVAPGWSELFGDPPLKVTLEIGNVWPSDFLNRIPRLHPDSGSRLG